MNHAEPASSWGVICAFQNVGRALPCLRRMQSLRRPLRFYVFYIAVIEFRAFLALPLTTGAGAAMVRKKQTPVRTIVVVMIHPPLLRGVLLKVGMKRRDRCHFSQAPCSLPSGPRAQVNNGNAVGP